MQQYAVDYSENPGGSSDAQSQNHCPQDSERGRFAELAYGVTKILEQAVHWTSSLVPECTDLASGSLPQTDRSPQGRCQPWRQVCARLIPTANPFISLPQSSQLRGQFFAQPTVILFFGLVDYSECKTVRDRLVPSKTGQP
jgi:hypothetical protein